MKTIHKIISLLTALALITLASCEQNRDEVLLEDEVSESALSSIRTMGFSDEGVLRTEGGYIVENDIFISDARLGEVPTQSFWLRDGDEEQYRTTNLVSTNGTRNITVYAPTGRKGYSAAMIAGIDEAIARYNAENLEISFSRISSSSADIVFTRLSKRDERRGVLGSAGFPTSSGDPFGQIRMSGILESSYGLNTDEIATIIAHEMGHCIGFRHTDYFDRSISCGGATSNEGQAGVGAINIPGTPTGASLSDQSWMLSCTDGSNRDFNADDVTALNVLY